MIILKMPSSARTCCPQPPSSATLASQSLCYQSVLVESSDPSALTYHRRLLWDSSFSREQAKVCQCSLLLVQIPRSITHRDLLLSTLHCAFNLGDQYSCRWVPGCYLKPINPTRLAHNRACGLAYQAFVLFERVLPKSKHLGCTGL